MPARLPALRTILFRLHWALGLTAGLVLALMGVTGALMSYEEALTAWADRDHAHVAVLDRSPLAPEALLARIAAQAPGSKVESLTLSGEPGASVRARFAAERGTRERPASAYVDPYDGTVLGAARWEAAFATIRSLHRWLLIPGGGKGWGRTVTGACVLGLLAFLATGLYLRWPKVHRWRIWLRPSLARPGRPRWWSLHAVVGTWLAPVYLCIALSGLWWSYDAYRAGAAWLLTGHAPEGRSGRQADPDRPVGRAEEPVALDRAWTAFAAGEGHDAALAVVTLPGPEAGPIRIRWLARGAEQPKARNEARFDARTGAPLSARRFEDKPLGQRIADAMLEVHRGRYFGDVAAFVFFLAALAMPGFAATGLTLYGLRRRAARRRPAPAPRDALAASRG